MKNKRKKVQLFLVFICFIFLSSCEYNYIEYDIQPAPDNVSFDSDIIPIFNASCNMGGCHTAGHFSVDLTPANAYVDIFAKNLVDTISPADSKLYSKLALPGTHDGRSDATQRSLILAWIEQGAKDN